MFIWCLRLSKYLQIHTNIIQCHRKSQHCHPSAAALKAQANNLFKSGDFDKAFDVFTAAISEENQSPALYSNRSAAAMKMKNFGQALKDAEKAVKVCRTLGALTAKCQLMSLSGTA